MLKTDKPIRQQLREPCAHCGRDTFDARKRDMPRRYRELLFCSWWCLGRWQDANEA